MVKIIDLEESKLFTTSLFIVSDGTIYLTNANCWNVEEHAGKCDVSTDRFDIGQDAKLVPYQEFPKVCFCYCCCCCSICSIWNLQCHSSSFLSLRYVDRISDSMEQKLRVSQKLLAQIKTLETKSEEAVRTQADIEPKLALIVKRTKELKSQVKNGILLPVVAQNQYTLSYSWKLHFRIFGILLNQIQGLTRHNLTLWLPKSKNRQSSSRYLR